MIAYELGLFVFDPVYVLHASFSNFEMTSIATTFKVHVFV